MGLLKPKQFRPHKSWWPTPASDDRFWISRERSSPALATRGATGRMMSAKRPPAYAGAVTTAAAATPAMRVEVFLITVPSSYALGVGLMIVRPLVAFASIGCV